MVEELLSGLRRPWFLSALGIVAGVAMGSPARADTIVSLCRSDVETGPAGRFNLSDAVARGGHVTFDCGARATLAITRTHIVSGDTRIDGGGADRITLDAGQQALTMFQVGATNVSLALANLTLANARSRGLLNALSRHRSASVVDLGGDTTSRLSLDSVEVRGAESPIYVAGGELTIRHARFQDNTGVTVESHGTNDIADSSFIGNDTGLAIAGYAFGAHFETTLSGAVIFANHRTGAVRVGVGGRLIATGTQFSNNAGAVGAALWIDGLADSVALRKTNWTDNVAQGDGGAIAIVPHRLTPAGRPPAGPVAVTVNAAAFKGNRAVQGSGGAMRVDLGDGGSLSIGGGRFLGNQAAVAGGAVSMRAGGALAIESSLLKGNSAPVGAALLLARSGTGGRIVNTLVVANIAAVGGGAVAANDVDFYNVTIADNEGGGLADGSANRELQDFARSPRVTLRNTVLADNRPANCVGRVRAEGNGASLQSPASTQCAGVEITAPAMLDSYFAPLPGSPALGRGLLRDCLAAPVGGRDVVAQKRGVGGICSIGAFEAAPTRRAEALARARQPIDQDGQHVP